MNDPPNQPTFEKADDVAIGDQSRIVKSTFEGDVVKSTIIVAGRDVRLLPEGIKSDEARLKYLDCLIKQNRVVNPRGFKQPKSAVTLELDQVYVVLAAETPKDQPDSPSAGKPPTDFEDTSDIRRFGRGPFEKQVVKVELPPTVRDHSHIVILGDPGTGKTTLLKFIALHFAREARNPESDGIVRDKDGNDYGEVRFPIPIRIALFADTFSKNRNLSIREYLPTAFGDAGIPPDVLKRLFDEALDDGKALVLFDGLDEVIDTGDRVQISQRIEEFAQVIPSGNRFVVTSRTVGYTEARLGGNFEEFTLCRLERPQIQALLNQLCYRIHKPNELQSLIETRAKQEIKTILDAADTRPGVRELAGNPLMLTLLTLLQRAGKSLTNRRVELFGLAVKTLLEDWQLARGIGSSNIIDEDEAMEVLAPLAFWIHTHSPSGLATDHEVKARLTEALAAWRNLKPTGKNIQDAVKDFLRRVREHTGVFVEHAPGQYGFLHLVFEEYLAARHLVDKIPNTAEVIQSHRPDPRWRETILLAVGYLSTSDPKKACDLIKKAVLGEGDGFEASPFEDVLHHDLMLAVQCLGDCDKTEPRFRASTVERLLKVYFESRISRLNNRILSILGNCCGGDTGKETIQQLSAALDDESEDVRRLAATALGNLHSIPTDSVARLLAAFRDPSENVSHAAAEALVKLQSNSPVIIDLLTKALEDKCDLVRHWAAYTLGRPLTASQKAVAALNAALNDQCESVRLLADQGLRRQQIAPSDTESPTIHSLDRPQSVTREQMAGLLVSLEDRKEVVRMHAIQTLGNFRTVTPEIRKGLLAGLNDQSWVVRREAVKALGRFQSIFPEIIAGLLDVLKYDENDDVRCWAADALGNFQSASHDIVDGLNDALQDQSASVRSGAAYALGKLQTDSPEIIDKILLVLKDQSWEARRGAAYGLGRLHPTSPKIVAGLLGALYDQNEEVQRAVSHALGRIQPTSPEIVKGLFSALTNFSETVQFWAGQALANHKSASPDTIATFIAALKTGSLVVKFHSAHALERSMASYPEAFVGKQKEIQQAVRKALDEPYTDIRPPLGASVGLEVFWTVPEALWEALWRMCALSGAGVSE